MSDGPAFVNLDLESAQIRALLAGVVLDAGTLRLAEVPGDPQSLSDAGIAANARGLAGIGVGPDGTIYMADPACDRVLRVPGCGGPAEEVGCLRQWLSEPRGVVVGPRHALYVADSGNDRVMVVDLATEQVRAVWEGLARPWDLAADGEQRLYVVASGSARVERLNANGVVDRAFGDALAGASSPPQRPQYIVLIVLDGRECLLVLDRTASSRLRALVYDLDGAFQQAATRTITGALREQLSGLPTAVASGAAGLCVAEAGTGRLLVFDHDGRFRGVARGFSGQTAGLAFDPAGRLVVNSAGAAPVRFGQTGVAASGSFRIGPFSGTRERVAVWGRLSVRADLPDGAHVRLFTFGTDDPAPDAPPLPAVPAVPAAADNWQPLPPDALDALVASEPSRWLWIGGRLQSTGETPVIRGLRLEHDGEGWLRYLPALYFREQRAFIEPALALFESALADEERLIDSLSALFDPAAAPGGWLEWLAGWVAVELEGVVAADKRRAAIAAAFHVHDRRGTAEGLRDAIALGLGVDVAVDEPGASASLWRLGDAQLGTGTGLAVAEADGAILDTTATLDRSVLQDETQVGAPALGALANRYCVRAYAADLPQPDGADLLERLVVREQPVGTDVHVCVIQPRARVGLQSTLGVDAIVGREATPMRLGADGPLGAGAALPPRAAHGLTVSDRTRVGRAPAVT